jgi:hypothetical protein
LQITKSMLDSIVSHYGIGSALWDLSSCFYPRNIDLEEGFCAPYSQTPTDTGIGTNSVKSYLQLTRCSNKKT